MNQSRHTNESLIVRRLSVLPWVYIASLSVLLATELFTTGAGATRLLFLIVLILPWVIGAIILTWSDGPVKNWAVRLIVSLSFSATLCYTALVLTRMAIFLGLSPVLCSGPIVAVPLAWYLFFLVHMSPRRCPVCEQRSLIPLMQLVITEALRKHAVVRRMWRKVLEESERHLAEGTAADVARTGRERARTTVG